MRRFRSLFGQQAKGFLVTPLLRGATLFEQHTVLSPAPHCNARKNHVGGLSGNIFFPALLVFLYLLCLCDNSPSEWVWGPAPAQSGRFLFVQAGSACVTVDNAENPTKAILFLEGSEHKYDYTGGKCDCGDRDKPCVGTKSCNALGKKECEGGRECALREGCEESVMNGQYKAVKIVRPLQEWGGGYGVYLCEIDHEKTPCCQVITHSCQEGEAEWVTCATLESKSPWRSKFGGQKEMYKKALRCGQHQQVVSTASTGDAGSPVSAGSARTSLLQATRDDKDEQEHASGCSSNAKDTIKHLTCREHWDWATHNKPELSRACVAEAHPGCDCIKKGSTETCGDGGNEHQETSPASGHEHSPTLELKFSSGGDSSHCAKRWQDCQQSKCCHEPGDKCYRQDKYYAQCKPGCTKDHVWSCEVLGASGVTASSDHLLAVVGITVIVAFLLCSTGVVLWRKKNLEKAKSGDKPVKRNNRRYSLNSEVEDPRTRSGSRQLSKFEDGLQHQGHGSTARQRFSSGDPHDLEGGSHPTGRLMNKGTAKEATAAPIQLAKSAPHPQAGGAGGHPAAQIQLAKSAPHLQAGGAGGHHFSATSSSHRARTPGHHPHDTAPAAGLPRSGTSSLHAKSNKLKSGWVHKHSPAGSSAKLAAGSSAKLAAGSSAKLKSKNKAAATMSRK